MEVFVVKKFYRVTYDNDGIYEALRKQVSPSTWVSLLNSSAFTWLPKPDVYTRSNRSYFTPDGYFMFNSKTLPIIITYLDKSKIVVDTYDRLNHIIYMDKYQVITES